MNIFICNSFLYKIIFFIAFISSYALQGASSSNPKAASELVDVTFNVEFQCKYGHGTQTYTFDKAIEHSRHLKDFNTKIPNPTKHHIQITADVLKARQIACSQKTEDSYKILFFVYDVHSRAHKIIDDVAKALSPDFKLTESAVKELRHKYRGAYSYTPAPFYVAAIFLFKEEYQIFTSSSSGYNRLYDVFILANDTIKFDFKDGSDLNIQSRNSTPFMEYLRSRNYLHSTYRNYLRLYAHDSSRYWIDYSGEGLVHAAVRESDIETVEKALEIEAVRTHISTNRHTGHRALEVAAARGCTSIVELLLSNGAHQCSDKDDQCVRLRNKLFSQPLCYALEYYGSKGDTPDHESRYALVQALLNAPEAGEALAHDSAYLNVAHEQLLKHSKDPEIKRELSQLIEQMRKIQTDAQEEILQALPAEEREFQKTLFQLSRFSC